MTLRNELISAAVNDYAATRSTPPDEVLRDLAAETARRFPDHAGMQIGPAQGGFLTLLAAAVGARSAVEVGTFTGYSAICLARGLAPGGRLLCCDVSEQWTSLAHGYWRRAGLADRIELRLAPALATLRSLPGDASFDLAFIDADKGGYVAYWEETLPRVRPGGVILVDNTLAHGSVVDPDSDDATTTAIRTFNDHAAADDRVDLVLLPIGDGLTLARRK